MYHNLDMGEFYLRFQSTYTFEIDTELGPLSLPDSSYWMTHPQFIYNFERLFDEPMRTFGHLQKFLRKYISTLPPRIKESLEELHIFTPVRIDFKQGSIYGPDYPLTTTTPTERHLRNTLRETPPASFLFPESGQEEGLTFGKPFTYFDGHRHLTSYYLTSAALEGDDEPQRHPQNSVRNYSYAPQYIKYSLEGERTARYYGLELEVNTEIPWDDMVKVITEVEPVQDLFLYAKSDSSISGRFRYSYELVSHPLTLRYAKRELKKLFTKLERILSERSPSMELSDVFDWTPNTNGLHIHISRDAFLESTKSGLSIHKQKFGIAWNNDSTTFQTWLRKITKRTDRNSYSLPDGDLKGRSLHWKLAEYSGGSRYTCCNINTRHNTCEVRVFHGTVDLKHIITCLELVDAFYEFCIEAPFRVFNMHFQKFFEAWLFKTPGYRNLKETIKCV